MSGKHDYTSGYPQTIQNLTVSCLFLTVFKLGTGPPSVFLPLSAREFACSVPGFPLGAPSSSHRPKTLKSALSSPVLLPKLSSGCPTCKSNTTLLGIGEPCGVYTLSCAQDLRCAPPEDDARPLRALLEGRGVCSNASIIGPTDNIDTAAAQTVDPERAPCRKLLTTLIKGLDAHLFDSQHDIYMPNCDKHGFFRRKQCWSSRGKRRGTCWCVDKNGMPVSSNTKQKGGPSS